MKYNEIIDLYKKGELSDNQREEVKRDIEKHEAISQYLFDNDELFHNEEFFDDDELLGNREQGDDTKIITDREIDEAKATGNKEEEHARKFAKMIRSYIRRAFIKMGIIVGVIVILITLFVIFGLPKVVDGIYYNPEEIAGERDGHSTNRLSLDWATYSELFIPGYYRYDVMVDGNGYGEYDIVVCQSSSVTGEFTNISGKIDKGELVMYDDSVLRRPTGNAFVPGEAGVEDYDISEGAAGNYEEAMASLQDLKDDEYYIAYVTLDEVMSYTEFTQWSESNNVGPWWCAMCMKTDTGYEALETIGFIYQNSAGWMFYDNEKYPVLSYYDATLETGQNNNWIIQEDTMTQHVVSMLRYMGAQQSFCEMVEYYNDDNHLESLAKNIEENGLNIYGFAAVGKKEDILALSEIEDVAYIYTNLMR